MTLNDVQRAALVLFAAREVGPAGSLDQMKAVCHVVRNRVQAPWHADWLEALEHHAPVAAHEPDRFPLTLNDRRLGQLARDVDEIFYGGAADDIARMCGRQDKDRGPLLYWCFIDRPLAPWFSQNVIGKPGEHKQRAQVGNSMYLFE